MRLTKGRIMKRWLTALVALGFTCAQAQQIFVENFDAAELPAGSVAKGRVTRVEEGAFKGGSLLIERANFDEPASCVLPLFTVEGGQLVVSGAVRTELDSPDNSFQGAVRLNCLDADGKAIRSFELDAPFGKVSWRTFTKTIDLPDGVAQAQISLSIEKAVGKFWIDALTAESVKGALPPSRVARVVAKIEGAIANMPYPDDPVIFTVTAWSKKPLSDDGRVAHCRVRDYWGVEQGDAYDLTLESVPLGEKAPGAYAYQGRVDISELHLPPGHNFDFHVELGESGEAAFKHSRSFIRMEEAPANALDPSQSPFTIRNWENSVAAYFPVAKRIGLRTAGVRSGWEAKAPYKPTFMVSDVPQKLGLATVMGTPLASLEHHRGNWQDYTDESLREGATKMITDPLAANAQFVVLGNEPPYDLEGAKQMEPKYKIVYEAIKAARPDITVIGTSIGPSDAYFASGSARWCDWLDFHSYEDYRTMPEIFANYEKVFEKYGFRKPICSTEIGLNSQGLPRHIVAETLIKKAAVFFAYGGVNFSWFTIEYPDPEGVIYGDSGEAHNTFDARFGMHSPKLDGLAYFHMVNFILDKKFVEKKTYDNGLEAYMFTNDIGDVYTVLWNDRGPATFGLALEGTDRVRVVYLDGTELLLAPENNTVTLRVGTEPLHLLYTQTAPKLPVSLAPSACDVQTPATLIKGGDATFTVTGNSDNDVTLRSAFDLRRVVPANLIAGDQQTTSLTLPVPGETSARSLRAIVMLRNNAAQLPHAALLYELPLTSPLSITAAPLSRAAICLTLANNSKSAQPVEWNLAIAEEYPLKKGIFDFVRNNRPAIVSFVEPASGTLTLDAGETKTIDLTLRDLDPLVILKTRATLIDSQQRVITGERLMGGFAPVRRAARPPALDGKLDDDAWQNARAVFADKPEQIYTFSDKAKPWGGPADLSAEIRYLWDNDHLYIGVTARDDIHSAPKSDSSIWNQDSLQILVDPARASAEKVGKYEYSLATGTKGTQAWCNYSASGDVPAGLCPDIQIAFARDDDAKISTYEIAIPWKQFAPFKPVSGANLGLALIVNEDDGNGRFGFIGWFSGVHMKELDYIGDLILD